MRAPNPKTLSRVIARAEGLRPVAGTALNLSVAEARALIYETSAKQVAVHYDGNVPSRHCLTAYAWDTCGWSDVVSIRGGWVDRRLAPAGYVRRFIVSIMRAASTCEVDIITPALTAPKVEG